MAVAATSPGTILITGASRGIGAGLAEGFASRGWNLVLTCSRSEAEMAETTRRIAETTKLPAGRILACKADVGDRAAVKALFDRATAVFGSVDVLVNNAGRNIDKPFLELSACDWNTVLQTILTGTFHCCQEFAARYQGEAGHIINIAASTGIRGRRNGANYCAAKAGVITLTRCLALELAPRIRVNCIVPGYHDTEEVMTRYNLRDPEGYRKVVETIPLGRLGTVQDLFRMARFLVEEAGYVTGQNLFVNGGHFMQ